MERLSSVCTTVPDGRLFSSCLAYHLKVRIDWIQMLPTKLILAEIYEEKKKKKKNRALFYAIESCSIELL